MDMVMYMYMYMNMILFLVALLKGKNGSWTNCNFGQVVAYGLDWIRELVLTQPFLVKDSDDY